MFLGLNNSSNRSLRSRPGIVNLAKLRNSNKKIKRLSKLLDLMENLKMEVLLLLLVLVLLLLGRWTNMLKSFVTIVGNLGTTRPPALLPSLVSSVAPWSMRLMLVLLKNNLRNLPSLLGVLPLAWVSNTLSCPSRLQLTPLLPNTT
jgi:hypothetical protein